MAVKDYSNTGKLKTKNPRCKLIAQFPSGAKSYSAKTITNAKQILVTKNPESAVYYDKNGRKNNIDLSKLHSNINCVNLQDVTGEKFAGAEQK